MATTSAWTGFDQATTDSAPGSTASSPWTAWTSATSFTPTQTEWWVAGDTDWVPATMKALI